MAIDYELLNKGGISLGTNFELLSEKPLDCRLSVPSLNGLQNYIENAAAYEGMIVYVEDQRKHYVYINGESVPFDINFVLNSDIMEINGGGAADADPESFVDSTTVEGE